jgi:hypothetical protein
VREVIIDQISNNDEETESPKRAEIRHVFGNHQNSIVYLPPVRSSLERVKDNLSDDKQTRLM